METNGPLWGPVETSRLYGPLWGPVGLYGEQ